MRSQASTAEDLSPGIVPSASWRVARVRVLAAQRLEVEFLDGTKGEADLASLIASERAGVFTALRDASLFDRAFVAHGAVTWPGGIDLPPDTMYDAIRATGTWTPE